MCNTCGGKNKDANGGSGVNPAEVAGRGKLNDCCGSKPAHQQSGANGTRNTQQHGGIPERGPCIGDYEQHLFEKLDEDICEKGPRDPYHIPGYSGHVPTVEARSGHTYGQDTHDVLTSQPGYAPSTFNKGSHICPEPMHQPYRIPGYTGHVPGLKSMVGGTYGGDTHKLLYEVPTYPNHQENLSPSRPIKEIHTYGNGGSEGQTGGSPTNGQSFGDRTHGHHSGNGHAGGNGHSSGHGQPIHAKPPQGDSNTTSTYERPKEHYYQPQLKYRLADTYATRADLTLVDPCINKESKVVVSTRELDDTQVVRTQDCLEERVESFPYINRPIRHRPVVPGFDTFIDALRGARGQRYEFTAVTPTHKRLQQQLILQKGKVRDLPGGSGADGGRGGDQCSPPRGGHNDLPFGYPKYGEHHKYTNSALYDFTSNYRRRMSSEWAPAGISRPDPPAFDVPGEIYNEHMGLLPGYSAHIPGALFRYGKTFTDDSRDARKALRGDRF